MNPAFLHAFLSVPPYLTSRKQQRSNVLMLKGWGRSCSSITRFACFSH